jgi:hypothetical protein
LTAEQGGIQAWPEDAAAEPVWLRGAPQPGVELAQACFQAEPQDAELEQVWLQVLPLAAASALSQVSQPVWSRALLPAWTRAWMRV